MTVRFAILGPVEISRAGQPLRGAAPRHRAVLAYLLLHARTVISVERLITAMWGPTPPDTARAQIHAAIAALRRVLRRAGTDELLQTHMAGYVIPAGPSQLDLAEFTDRTAAVRAGADPAGAAAELRSALALWRGQPLAGMRADYTAGARARLEERHLTAFEQLADLELSLGRHEQIIDELTAYVAAHPLRERLSRQLMLALHRSGRQADALAVGRTLREALADQQGLTPGRAFTTQERAILRDDPSLHSFGVHTSASPTTTPPAPSAAATRPGALPQRANFLPYATPDFCGRSAELQRLLTDGADGGGAATVHGIDGMAGVGKTALAVHAGHRLADAFPDGQLFVDLGAHCLARPPLETGAALGVLLRQLGVPPEHVPASAIDRAALWRAELADRRALVLLDDAAGTAQVRAFLPGVTRSRLLVTSRHRLTDLDGVVPLSLDPLPEMDALRMFTRIAGKPAAADPLAAVDVVHQCGRLPLAVRIAASRLRHRSQWTAAQLADRLRDERRRLPELSTSERGIAAALAPSYRQLTPAQRRMFRLLGLHPGPDIDAGAASALTGVGPQEADGLLEGLLDAHLLRHRGADRYTFHDLLRQYAYALAQQEESVGARRRALTRLFDHYLAGATAAAGLLFPGDRHTGPNAGTPAVPGSAPFTDEAAARAWLAAEHANLLATGTHMASHGWPGRARRLAAALHRSPGEQSHHVGVHLDTWARRAARARRDRPVEGHTVTDPGWRYGREGHEQAPAWAP